MKTGLFLALAAAPARAAPAVPPAASETSSAIPAEPSTWQAGVRAGYVLASIPGGGAELFHRVDDSWSFGLLALSGARDYHHALSVPDGTVESATVRGQLVVLQARRDLFPHLHASAGFGARRYDFTYALATDDGTGRVVTTGDALSLVAHASLGSYWALGDDLLLGCEWYGYSQPLRSRVHTAVATEGAASESTDDLADAADTAARRLARGGARQTLLLGAGFRF